MNDPRSREVPHALRAERNAIVIAREPEPEAGS
jgi:hypothetical protein